MTGPQSDARFEPGARFVPPPLAVDPVRWSRPPERRPVVGLGVAATVLIVLAVLADAISAVAEWHRYALARDYVAGDPGVTDADLVGADNLSMGLAVAGPLLYVAAGVVFMVWLWRARANAEYLCEGRHRRSRGWVIGGWFCPVVGFWFPYQIVADVWRASDPGTPRRVEDLRYVPSPRLVLAWWVGFLLSGVIAMRAVLGDDEVTVDFLRRAAWFETASATLSVAAAFAVGRIIAQIGRWQSDRSRTGWWESPPGEVQPE